VLCQQPYGAQGSVRIAHHVCTANETALLATAPMVDGPPRPKSAAEWGQMNGVTRMTGFIEEGYHDVAVHRMDISRQPQRRTSVPTVTVQSIPLGLPCVRSIVIASPRRGHPHLAPPLTGRPNLANQQQDPVRSSQRRSPKLSQGRARWVEGFIQSMERTYQQQQEEHPDCTCI
jgi:hypothetical protein